MEKVSDTVRKYWWEIFDDLEKEHSSEMEACKRALSKMEARALKAEHQADGLRDKLTQERREKYGLGAELEEANGKIPANNSPAERLARIFYDAFHSAHWQCAEL